MTIEVSVYPNPFDNFISIEVICEEEKNCIILLADVQNAKIIRMLGAGLGRGLNKIPLQNLQSLGLGSYQLDIKDPDGDTLYKTKLIKQ
jgi:hypothetical protein